MSAVGRALLLAVVALSTAAVPLLATADSNGYLDAGVPATDRTWLGPDYARAATIIGSGKVDLPVLEDPAGAAVLRRFVSLENLALARNKRMPIGSRIDDASLILGGTNALLTFYLDAANSDQDVHREVTLVMVFSLRVMATVLPLIDEFATSVSDFEKQPVRVEGRRKVLNGAMTMFSGAEVSLSETHFYSDEDISQLLAGMAETLPVLKAAFTPDYRTELRIKLKEHKARLDRPQDRASIDRMLREVGE